MSTLIFGYLSFLSFYTSSFVVCYQSILQLPTIIADNAGYDSSELIAQMRAMHAEGKDFTGLGRRGGEEFEMCPSLQKGVTVLFLGAGEQFP